MSCFMKLAGESVGRLLRMQNPPPPGGSVKHWCRWWGWKHTVKIFDLVKILAKSVEIWAKSLKTFTNFLKIWAKMAPNMLWF